MLNQGNFIKYYKFVIFDEITLIFFEKLLTSVNKRGNNEYNNSRYLISAIIKNVSRNPICVE